MRRLAVSSAPGVDAITVAEIKARTRVEHADDDDDLDIIKAAAIEAGQGFCRRAFITQTLTCTFDVADLSAELRLFRPPIQSITSIVGTLQDATTEAVTAYITDLVGGRVMLKTWIGATWPSPLQPINSLVVTYVAGYGDAAADLPGTVRSGLLALAAAYYERRIPEEKWGDPGAIPPEMQGGLLRAKFYGA